MPNGETDERSMSNEVLAHSLPRLTLSHVRKRTKRERGQEGEDEEGGKGRKGGGGGKKGRSFKEGL